MIEHADAALEAWLSTLDPPVDVSFERLTDDAAGTRGKQRPVLSLVLTSVREQLNKRDNQVTDVRSDEGRVVGRQAATRFFELDYQCTAGGPVREAHRALGDVLQLFVEHDIVPSEFVPEELRDLGYPIDTTLVSSVSPIAALTLRVVLPVQPAPNVHLGPPVTSLHMDMAPPPQTRKRGAPPAIASPAPPAESGGPVPERKWTTVRRRELINRQQWAAAQAEDAAAKPKPPRKGS
jgi:uncharacterized protein DUF4255